MHLPVSLSDWLTPVYHSPGGGLRDQKSWKNLAISRHCSQADASNAVAASKTDKGERQCLG